MKKTRFMLLVCLVSSFLMTSYSFAAVGPYVSGQVGATSVLDADNTAFGDTIETSYDLGFNVGAAGGYDFGLLRVEGEITYRQNDVDELGVPGTGSVGGDGDISAFSLMANGFWDIETGSPVTPYLGAGIGVALVSMNDVGALGLTLADDDDTVFAYQFAAGVAFDLNPSMALDLGYRFFATTDPEFTDPDGVKFDSEYMSHNLSLGLRYTF
jgi:opacity protein-like surface antigen